MRESLPDKIVRKIVDNMSAVKLIDRVSDKAYERGFVFLFLVAVLLVIVVLPSLVVDTAIVMAKGLIALRKILSTKLKELKERRERGGRHETIQIISTTAGSPGLRGDTHPKVG